MTDTTVVETPELTTTDAIKDFGKFVTKEVVYQMIVQVTAASILLGGRYAVSKVLSARREAKAKKVSPSPVEEK